MPAGRPGAESRDLAGLIYIVLISTKVSVEGEEKHSEPDNSQSCQPADAARWSQKP